MKTKFDFQAFMKEADTYWSTNRVSEERNAELKKMVRNSLKDIFKKLKEDEAEPNPSFPVTLKAKYFEDTTTLMINVDHYDLAGTSYATIKGIEAPYRELKAFFETFGFSVKYEFHKGEWDYLSRHYFDATHSLRKLKIASQFPRPKAKPQPKYMVIDGKEVVLSKEQYEQIKKILAA